jgi:hypothetical protein
MNTPTAKDVATQMLEIYKGRWVSVAPEHLKLVCTRLLELEEENKKIITENEEFRTSDEHGAVATLQDIRDTMGIKGPEKSIIQEIDALKSQLAEMESELKLVKRVSETKLTLKQDLAQSQARCGKLFEAIESIHSTALSAEIKTGDKDEILGICDEVLCADKDKGK